MTREEAINEWVVSAIKNTWNEKKCGEIIEALEQKPYEKFESVKDHICKLAGDYKCWDNRLTDDEALELCRILEREPCTDCISREAVKELFQEACEMKMYDFLGIDDLPPVNPQPKTGYWIPVSENLPENAFVGCLATVEEDDRFGEPQRVIYPEFIGYDGETWNDSDGDVIPFEVIAWMPLPGPFREEDKDEN